MMTLLQVGSDGSVKGLRVVGFHGDVDGDETPAKLGPVYVDGAGSLAHVVELGPTRSTPAGQIRIETYPPPFPEHGPLPGQGTRIGPWPAQPAGVVMAVGPQERRLIGELRRQARTRGRGRVPSFVEWFASDEQRSDALSCERQEDVALWCCREDEAFSLLECVHRVVRDVFFEAVRSRTPDALEDAAWWLQRAAIADEDIFLAGAALRSLALPEWKILVREALHLPKESDWEAKLAEAARYLEHPPPVVVPQPSPRVDQAPPSAIGAPLSKCRSTMRHLFASAAA